MASEESGRAKANDPTSVKAAGERDAKREKQRDQDLRAVLRMPEGRRFLFDLIGMCGVYENSFSAVPGETFHKEGKRLIGTTLLKKINDADPKAWIDMQVEKLKEEES